MPEDIRQDLRNRLRAARAYHDVSLDELAEACAVDRGVVTRWLRTERPQRFPEEAYGPFALRCGVPEEFLRHGWPETWYEATDTAASTRAPLTVEQRIDLLERLIIPQVFGSLGEPGAT